MGQRHAAPGQLGGDAQRRPSEPRQHDTGVVSISDGKTCIYPGCERPAVAPHQLGGPQPSFCDLEEHNALSAHQERERLAAIRDDDDKEDQ